MIIVNSSKLMELRIKAGLTKSALAKESGTTTSLISRLETTVHAPRPDNAVKICKALKVEFDELFEISELKRKEAR